MTLVYARYDAWLCRDVMASYAGTTVHMYVCDVSMCMCVLVGIRGGVGSMIGGKTIV